MSAKKNAPAAGRTPSAREVLRPAELVGGSAGLALFGGLIMWVSTRTLLVGAIGFGVIFIVALVVIALFVQSIKPDASEQADLAEQDARHGGTRPVLADKPEPEQHEGH
ncbi:MAG: ABC transporter ATP-binding protein [Microbacteriaceae bacterium]|nr:ABC transporter ATP-binding protein [Microbacteriaceae bacterium]